MSEVGARFSNVAGRFSDTVAAVPEDAWSNAAPCEGWVARDVVGHLVGWVPGFLTDGSGIEVNAGPSVDDDPAGAWDTLRRQLQAILDDPELAAGAFRHPQAGTHRVDDAIAMFVLGDVLVHTWDLARAAGVDDTIDETEAAGQLAGMEGMGDALVASGHYQPAVPVPDDAGVQDRLIAATGRDPNWHPG